MRHTAPLSPLAEDYDTAEETAPLNLYFPIVFTEMEAEKKKGKEEHPFFQIPAKLVNLGEYQLQQMELQLGAPD